MSFLPRHGSSFSIGSMAGKAKLLINDFPFFHGTGVGLATAFLGAGFGASRDGGALKAFHCLDGFVVRVFIEKAIDEGGENRVLGIADADGIDCLKGHFDIVGDMFGRSESLDDLNISIGKEGFGDTDGGRSDKGRSVIEGCDEDTWVDFSDALESPK